METSETSEQVEVNISDIESEIINTFAAASSFLGYSEAHGRIIAALLVSGKAISLDELANKTSYSASMISLSLDLLEVMGIIRRVKKQGDRKLYIELQGDLMEAVRTAILLKINKVLEEANAGFEEYENAIKACGNHNKDDLLDSLGSLKNELRRIEDYINELAKVEIPK